MASRALHALVLVPIPLIPAVVAKHDIAAGKCIEMATARRGTRGHAALSVLLAALVGREGGDSKADGEAGGAQRPERQGAAAMGTKK